MSDLFYTVKNLLRNPGLTKYREFAFRPMHGTTV